VGGLTVTAGPDVWAGPECAYLTVGDWACDQLALTGHDRRPDDIDRMAELGVSAVRYPVLWGRGRRRRAATDWRWAEARLGRLAELRVEPIVGLLHHGYGPSDVGPVDAAWPAAFGRYAAAAARRLPARTWLPINEPLTTARFGGLYGWWPPYRRDPDAFADVLIAQALAFLEASHAIRAAQSGATIVVNEDLGRTFGSPALRDVVAAHNDRRWLTFDLLTGRVDRSHRFWPALAGNRARRHALDRLRRESDPPDILGIDHYVTSDRFLDDGLDRYPPWTHAEDGARHYADVELVRVAGHRVDGFRRAIRETWDRYGIPVALTEVQLAGEPTDQVAWWLEAWSAAAAASAAGVPVRGVTAWATFGSFDWATILRAPCGSYEPGCFDVRGGEPLRTALGDIVAATATGARPDPAPGWWRRDERVLYRPGDPADKRPATAA